MLSVDINDLEEAVGTAPIESVRASKRAVQRSRHAARNTDELFDEAVHFAICDVLEMLEYEYEEDPTTGETIRKSKIETKHRISLDKDLMRAHIKRKQIKVNQQPPVVQIIMQAEDMQTAVAAAREMDKRLIADGRMQPGESAIVMPADYVDITPPKESV